MIIRSLKKEMEELRAWEARAVQLERDIREKIRRGERVSKNINIVHGERLTLGERMSDRLADTAGSWGFIGLFFLFLVFWIAINSVQSLFKPFDHYPYILLNLMLSCLAAIQAPVIMMSQNRAQKKDRLKADLDYQVNVKSELMLQQLHKKMDRILEEEITEMKKGIKNMKTPLKAKRRIRGRK